MNKLAKSIQSVMTETDKRKPKPYDTLAEVVNVEGKTAWVKIPGGVNGTPVEKTINANIGDTVRIRVANGRAWITGNQSAPPTDDKLAISAKKDAHIANVTAVQADETANVANGTAKVAKKTAESILVYDHSYVLNDANTVATFTAYLYKGGVDVKEQYDEELFTWYLKTEAGESFIGYGYTMNVLIEGLDYGAEVIGYFTETDDAELLDYSGSNLTDQNGNDYTVRADGDSVRVRDLVKTTTLYPTDHVMVVTAEDEKLVSVQTLSDAVDKHYIHNQQVPSAVWTVTHNLRKRPSITVVDSAENEVIGAYEYLDDNTVELTFIGAFSGKAYFN